MRVKIVLIKDLKMFNESMRVRCMTYLVLFPLQLFSIQPIVFAFSPAISDEY